MSEKTVLVRADFDAAAVAQLVQVASRFESSISIVRGDKTANAKSIMGLISIVMSDGGEAKIVASGADAADAIEALEKVLE